jgi:hypothetical protein
MKNSDVRSVCLALVRSRIGGAHLIKPPAASALGLRLEHSDVPPHELASLCGAAIEELRAQQGRAPAQRWQPSASLRALLLEYRRARRQTPRARLRVQGYAALDAIS